MGVRDVSGDKESYAFIRKYDKHHTVVVNIKTREGLFFLHKTFFSQKRAPYKNAPSIKNELSGVGGVSTISQPPGEEAPAGSFSARPEGSLDASNLARTENSVKAATCLIKNLNETDSLPHLRI